MSSHFPSHSDPDISPSFPRQFTKKYDLIQKIQKLGAKPKSKYNLTRMPQSPKSPSNSNQQQFHFEQELNERRSPKPSQTQNDIISSLKSQLLNIKQDVSKLMGKEKERSANNTQYIKNQRMVYSPKNDSQSLASENVNMYRYKNRNEGFKLRSDEYNRNQEYQISVSGNDAMSEVSSLYKRKQIGYKPKMVFSPKVSTMDYIDVDRAFKKSPKAWQVKGLETSIASSMRSNVNNHDELFEANRTIIYLQGIIQDSNNIRRGLQSKIASFKKFQANSSSEQCKMLRERLAKEQQNRYSLEQKIHNLTQQIEVLQQQMLSSREQTSKSRNSEDSRSIELYQSKIKSLIESHNREMFGLKTENKLYKLNLEKYQIKQRAQKAQLQNSASTKQLILCRSQQNINILLKPNKKIVSFVNIHAQTQQNHRRQDVKISTQTTSCQTQIIKELDLLETMKQQMLEVQTKKYELQVKCKEFETAKLDLQIRLSDITKEHQSFKQTQIQRILINNKQVEELNRQLNIYKHKVSQNEKSITNFRNSLQHQKLQKLKLIQEQSQFEKEKSEILSQIKIDSEIITQLNHKIIHLQQQFNIVENKYKQQILEKKAQISAHMNDNRRLTELYTQKCKSDQTAHSQKHIYEEHQEERNRQLETQLQKLNLYIEQIKYNYNTQVAELKSELRYRKSTAVSNTEAAEKGFDESLKHHLSEIHQLKHQIEEKKQLIIQLKEECRSLRTLADNNRAELEIQKLRAISERKTLTVSFEIQIQNIKNQLNYQRKASNSINTKLKLLNEENKRKDQFLQKYILGKNISEEFRVEVMEFFRRYEEQFSIDRLKDRVFSETEIIEKLMEDNKVLIKNICQLREEAIRSQTGSLEIIGEVQIIQNTASKEGEVQNCSDNNFDQY